MLKKIKWIFFDTGSTLVDESNAYKHRIMDTVINSHITYLQFYNKMLYFANQGKNGYSEAVKYYRLKPTAWHSEDEFLYPETEKCLQLLSSKYKIGIIANQLSGLQDRLNKMGIAKYISLVISSAEEGISKPDLNIFYIALERAKCNAENAVMIGDRIDNDIIPAKAVGMYTIWLKQGLGGLAVPNEEREMADRIAYNISEIYRLFME